MQKPCRGTKDFRNPSGSLERSIELYSLAAAAGLSLLVCAPGAKAEVVYTPSRHLLKNGQILIDLNHDGVVDFRLVNRFYGSCTFGNRSLSMNGAGAAGASVIFAKKSYLAAALPPGTSIGSNGQFRSVTTKGLTLVDVINDSNSFHYNVGNFVDQKNRFLGLKFVINGETHYGWARMLVVRSGFDSRSCPYITAGLDGYAYETTPNMPIIAGDQADILLEQDSASNTAPAKDTPQPASLGLLALGAPGMQAWRRKESQDAV